MARSNVVALRQRTPRFTPGIACNAWLDISEAARRWLEYIEDEMPRSFAEGRDVQHLRRLQSLHREAHQVMAQGRRMAAWADGCADGLAEPGHGVAA